MKSKLVYMDRCFALWFSPSRIVALADTVVRSAGKRGIVFIDRHYIEASGQPCDLCGWLLVFGGL